MLFRLQPNALGAGFTADRSTLVALPARPEPILPLEGLCGERRADTKMPYSENRQRNRILDSLSDTDLALLRSPLQPAVLAFRKRLQSCNRTIKTVYFPESGLGSVVAVGSSRAAQAEIAIIGREGMTGLPIVLGTDRSPCEFLSKYGRELYRASPCQAPYRT